MKTLNAFIRSLSWLALPGICGITTALTVAAVFVVCQFPGLDAWFNEHFFVWILTCYAAGTVLSAIPRGACKFVAFCLLAGFLAGIVIVRSPVLTGPLWFFVGCGYLLLVNWIALRMIKRVPPWLFSGPYDLGNQH